MEEQLHTFNFNDSQYVVRVALLREEPFLLYRFYIYPANADLNIETPLMQKDVNFRIFGLESHSNLAVAEVISFQFEILEYCFRGRLNAVEYYLASGRILDLLARGGSRVLITQSCDGSITQTFIDSKREAAANTSRAAVIPHGCLNGNKISASASEKVLGFLSCLGVGGDAARYIIRKYS